VRDDGPPAVDRDGRPGDEARLVGEQVGDRGRDLLGAPGAADRVQAGELGVDALGDLGWVGSYSSWKREVTIEPGATALTRIPRAPYSTARARVRPSVAALAVT
jgi:hypothetical protein